MFIDFCTKISIVTLDKVEKNSWKFIINFIYLKMVKDVKKRKKVNYYEDKTKKKSIKDNFFTIYKELF